MHTKSHIWVLGYATETNGYATETQDTRRNQNKNSQIYFKLNVMVLYGYIPRANTLVKILGRYLANLWGLSTYCEIEMR